MRNSKEQWQPQWFYIVTWLLIVLCMDMTSAQGSIETIARRARADAELEIRRQNDVSRSRAAMSRPRALFMPPMTAFGAIGGPRPRRPALSSAAQLSKVHGARSVSPALSNAARVFQLSSKLFLQRAGREAASSSSGLTGFHGALSDICPRSPPPCSFLEPYRRADGTCNNFWFPLQGSQSTPQPRHLVAAYEDFFDAPRLHGVSGFPLPSARKVSNHVHRGVGPDILQQDVTLFLMQWGQFTDHDLVQTPVPLEPGTNKEIKCCEGGQEAAILHPECLIIEIPPDDPYFPPSFDCMNFVRSIPAISAACMPGQRQQLNLLTSYIDASNVYGSTQEKQDQVRGPKLGGKLNHIGPNLPDDPEDDCNKDFDKPGVDYCLLAGDGRVMEQSALTMIHTAFMREHNRIAAELSGLGDDETIFQEARKIVAAEMQHITYNEYLPIILGDAYMRYFGLYSTPSGFNWVYDPFIDASIVNVFAAATYRYGHSQIPNEMRKAVTVEGFQYDPRDFDDLFFRPNMILKPAGADAIARYVATANSHIVDSRIEHVVRDKLFKDLNDPIISLDLAALNIQRGRDHGLQPYNAYRELCGQHPYLTWGDATDHDGEDVAKLMLAYSDPRDIDMFAGAMSERPLPGGLLGPTNACILGNQFLSLKRGDRFFYENPFSITGFSLSQLNSIKTTTLARIICKNMNTPMIQRNIFRKVGPGNPLVSCDSLPDIHFPFWLGNQQPPGHMFHGPSFAPPASPVSPLNKPKVPKFMVPNIPKAKKQFNNIASKLPKVKPPKIPMVKPPMIPKIKPPKIPKAKQFDKIVPKIPKAKQLFKGVQ